MIKLLLAFFLVGTLILLGLMWLVNQLWWLFLEALQDYLRDKSSR
jgi:hypothetical protein